MRLTHVVTLAGASGAYGGPLRVALEQCKEMMRRGHEVSLVAGWIDATEPPSSLEGVPARLVRVHRTVPGPRFSGLFSAAMEAELKQVAERSDVMHVHLARDLVPLRATSAARRARTPYVVQTHGMIVADSRLQARLVDSVGTRTALEGAAARLVLTEIERTALAQVTGAPTTILRNGVMLDDGLQWKAPATEDVLFLARLHPRKRVMVFAEAARILHERFPEARFTVIGPDGGDSATLNDFANAHPNIGLHLEEGALPPDEVRQRMARASLYVLPSVDEPFPMTVLEALAVGTPTIMTDSCGIADELRARQAAVVIDHEVESLVNAVAALLDSPNELLALGQRGRAAAAELYSMGAVGDVLDSIYDHAVHAR